MKNPQKPNDLPPLPDRAADLSEEIAAEEEEDELDVLDNDLDEATGDPEVTTWDEPVGLDGRRLKPTGFEDESEFARELVEGGADLAETETRDLRKTDEEVEEAQEAAAESGKTRR